MNERIRELAEQAGFSFKYKTAPDELNPGHKLQDLEKFAELIVRECAIVCSLEQLIDADDEFKRGINKGAINCEKMVKEHFGVEE